MAKSGLRWSLRNWLVSGEIGAAVLAITFCDNTGLTNTGIDQVQHLECSLCSAQCSPTTARASYGFLKVICNIQGRRMLRLQLKLQLWSQIMLTRTSSARESYVM